MLWNLANVAEINSQIIIVEEVVVVVGNDTHGVAKLSPHHRKAVQSRGVTATTSDRRKQASLFPKGRAVGTRRNMRLTTTKLGLLM
jgi:hypothetical protein